MAYTKINHTTRGDVELEQWQWLSNEIRPFVGLELVLSSWDLVELKKGYYVYFDGDVIRKRISSSPEAYQEEDVDIKVRERAFVLPKTNRGKEKKLNYTSVSSFKADGVTFSAGIKSHDGKGYVTAYNSRNSMNLPFSGYEHLSSKEEIVAWLAHFPTTIPTDYEQKLNRLKHMKNQGYHAVPGDIFRVELDLFTYGYVLVIGNLRDMEKDNLFIEECIWKDVMTMPLFVRPYLWKTAERSPSLEDIVAAPLSESTKIVMDDYFLRGRYELIYHKELEEEEIVFPIGYGPSLNYGKERMYRLSWGLGTVFKPEGETTFKPDWNFLNHGVSAGISPVSFAPPSERVNEKTLTHPQYEQEWKQVLREFGFSENITYDEFCQETGALTRLQYLDYVKRKYK